MSQTIGKQIISGDFEATNKYICSKAGAQMLDSNMGGSDYKQLAQEFLAIARMRPNNNRLCLHAMLALPHRDESHPVGAINETLSDEQWVEIGQRWLHEMGFDDNQYFMVRHTDTEHDHLHIVASRVKLDGEVVSDSHNYHRSEAIIRKIEQDYKLEAVTPSWETYRRAPGRAELKEFERTGTDSVRLTIAALARDAASSHPTMPEYMERMRELGVGVEVHANRNGIVRGLSYEMNGYPFQGGDIGKDYTWNGLQQYLGVTYVASRDFETICTKERSTSGGSYKSARTSKSVGNGSSTVEPAFCQPAAADNQLDERKQRLEAAFSQLNRSTDQLTAAANQLNRSTSDYDRWLEQVDRVSLERTEQPSRNLAIAPNGAASTSGGAGEDTGNNRQLVAGQLEQLGAAVHEFNAELESPPVRHQAAGDGSRAESREARASNSTTSTTTGWSQADIHRQFEQLSLILDSLKRQRESEIEELEKRRTELERIAKELAAGANRVNDSNEPDRAGVEESRATEEMAGTLEEFSQRNRELTESSFNLTSGIRRLSAELAGATVGHFLKTDGKREQPTEAQAIRHPSFGEPSLTNPEERRATERTQQEGISTRNTEAGNILIDPKMREDADLILSIAARAYKYLDARKKVTEVSPGTMVAETTDYTLTLQPEDEIFSIAAKSGRGEIVRYEVDKLKRARNIQPSDVEEWLGIEQKLDAIEMEQEAERQKEVERIRQLQQQKKRNQLSL